MNASDIVAVLSGVGTMVTAIYIGVNSFRDKTAKDQRKKEVDAISKMAVESGLIEASKE